MYKIIRPLLFKLNPEDIHALTLDALNNTRYVFGAQWLLKEIYKAPPKPVEAFGLTFPNPVGLAAGFDKNAAAVRSLSLLGFGHIEVGTVTPLKQRGNPEPRVFRLAEDEAIINRMGFPSHGSVRVVKSLKKLGHCRYPLPTAGRVINLRRFFPEGRHKRKNKEMILGVNIGKNKTTPNEEAVLDYLALLENFAPCADYLTINISSPNTKNLRDLQARSALEKLLKELDYQRKLEEEKLEKKVPLLVKLSPDLSEAALDDALDVILATDMDGIIATNTTVSRPAGLKSASRLEEGGLSGDPLRVASEAALRQIVAGVNGKIPVISSGGIMSPDDAKRRLDLGARLIQIYTGLVYEGPGFVKKIVKAL
jgi:dihydroorotate dehydrogenase